MDNNKNNTLFILDWDDTLFPTNWVINNNVKIMLPDSHDHYMVYFQELDRVLSKFLNKLTSYGRVIIVTNAALEWVNISSIVLPKTYHLLKKVKIVSARTEYKKKSSNMMDWKTMAFRDIIDNEFKNSSLINVISIGDAEYEYQALISLNKTHRIKGIKYLKSIRFMRQPTHDILIDQLNTLNDAIPQIWNKTQHLDLKFDHFSKN